MPTVKIPSRKLTLKFPDTMSQDQIDAIVQRDVFGKPPAAPKPAAVEPDRSIEETLENVTLPEAPAWESPGEFLRTLLPTAKPTGKETTTDITMLPEVYGVTEAAKAGPADLLEGLMLPAIRGAEAYETARDFLGQRLPLTKEAPQEPFEKRLRGEMDILGRLGGPEDYLESLARGAETKLEGPKQELTALGEMVVPVQQLYNRFMSLSASGAAGFAGTIDAASEYLEKATGLPKAAGFELLRKGYLQARDYWDKRAGEVGLVPELLAEFLSSITGMANLALGTPWAGFTGWVEGGPEESARRMVEMAITKKILFASHVLKRLSRTGAMATLGAVQAAPTGDIMQMVKSAGVMSGFGLLGGPGELTGREALQEAWRSRPYQRTSATERPGFQPSEVKTSEAIQPSEVRTTRPTLPLGKISSLFTRLSSSLGRSGIAKPSDATVAQEGAVVKQPTNDLNELVSMAHEMHEPIKAALNQITGEDTILARVKAPESIARKLTQAEEQPGNLTDILGAAVLPDDLYQIKATVPLIRQAFRVIKEENFFVKPGALGYRGYHVEVELPNGLITEIQFHTKHAWPIKEEAHGIYELLREHGQKIPEAYVEELTRRSYDLFEQAYGPERDSRSVWLEQPVSSAAEAPSVDRTPGPAGKQTPIVHVGGEDPATYRVIELADIRASHLPSAGFAKNSRYPEGLQERIYHSDPNEQLKVIQNGQRYNPSFVLTDNPDPVNGPPIVTKDGLVLGGNSRAMTLEWVYGNNPEAAAAYRDMLKQKAETFGIDPAEVDKLKHPVLVRQLAEDLPDMAAMKNRIRSYNQTFLAGMSKAAEAVARGAQVSQDTLEAVGTMLAERDVSIRALLDTKDADRVINLLTKDGVIEKMQRARFVNAKTGALTEDGKDLIERTLLGRVINDPDLLDMLPKSAVKLMERSLPQLAQLQARGETWDISGDLKAALVEFSRFKRSDFKLLPEYFAQRGAFGVEPSISDRARVILEALVQWKPTRFQKALADYAAAATRDVKGQETMFGKPETPEQAFDSTFGELYEPERVAARKIGPAEGQIGLFAGAKAEKASNQSQWDNATPEKRIEWTRRGAWVTGKGNLSTTGEKIAKSKWENLSPAAQRIIAQHIEAEAKKGPPRLVQRIEEPGASRASLDKTQGIYTSPAEIKSPHADLGGERHLWEINPDAKFLEIPPYPGKEMVMRSGAVDAGAGVHAARYFLGDKEFKNLKSMSKKELAAWASERFPGIDFARYFDRQEVMEAIGASLARKEGIDLFRVKGEAPEWDEIVLLTEKAAKPAAKVAPEGGEEGKPPGKAKAPEAKEPWEMTQAEVEQIGHIGYDVATGKAIVIPSKVKGATGALASEHGRVVATALKEGKPVPPEVLAEYPDLKPAAPKEPEQAKRTPREEIERKGVYHGPGFTVKVIEAEGVRRSDRERFTVQIEREGYRSTIGGKPLTMEGAREEAVEQIRRLGRKFTDLHDWVVARNAELREAEKIQDPSDRINKVDEIEKKYEALKDPNWVTSPTFPAQIRVKAKEEIKSQWRADLDKMKAETDEAVETNLKAAGDAEGVELQDPTGKSPETFFVTKSAKEPGRWQATYLIKGEPHGDYDFASKEAAIRSISGDWVPKAGPPVGNERFRVTRTKTGKKVEEKPVPKPEPPKSTPATPDDLARLRLQFPDATEAQLRAMAENPELKRQVARGSVAAEAAERAATKRAKAKAGATQIDVFAAGREGTAPKGQADLFGRPKEEKEQGVLFSTQQPVAAPAGTPPPIPYKPVPPGVRRSAIIEAIEKRISAPIRFGKIRTRKVAGLYKREEGVIRVKKANDVETAVHETAHHVEELLGLPKIMPQEVRALAYAGATNLSREGFAEFFRLYTLHETEARQKAPTFTPRFEQALKDVPELQDLVVVTRQAWQEWQALPAVERVSSFIRRGRDVDKGRRLTFSDVYTKVKDALYPLQIARDLAKERGHTFEPSTDPYILARLTRGWARKAEQFLKYGTFQLDEAQGVTFTGKSLREILEPVERAGEMELLDTYLVARRAVSDERVRKGFEGILSASDFQKAVQELKPKYGKIAQEIHKYSDELLKYLTQSGRISQELADHIRAKNAFYAPLYRVMDTEPTSTGLSSRKFGSLFNPIKRLGGSSRDIYSPTENLLYNTYTMINAAERARVGEAMIRLSQMPGMGDVIEKVPVPLKPVKMGLVEALRGIKKDLQQSGSGDVATSFYESIDNILKHQGAVKKILRMELEGKDLAEIEEAIEKAGLTSDDVFMLSQTLTSFRPNLRTGPNEAIFYHKGEPVLFELAPELAKAINNIDVSSVNALVKILSYPAKMLRAGATTFSPEFGLRNPARDQMTAFIQSKYGFVPGVDFARGIFHMMGKTELWQKFNASGAAHAAIVSLDRQYLSKNLKEIMQARGVKGAVRHPLEAFQRLSEYTEEASRVGEFARALKAEGGDLNALLKSGLAGREVSIDFARIGGETSRAINLMSAFWNARLEGIDKLGRSMKENPVGTSIRAFLGVTLPSVLLWYHQKDDPYFQELPGWRRTLFWNIVLHKDDGSLKGVISIPKPFEWGLLFGSLPEMALDWAYTQDPSAFKETAAQIAQTFQLLPIPTGVIPLAEGWADKSWFFNRPIVPRDTVDLKPTLQYGPHTSHAARLAAQAMDKIPGLDKFASPAKIENLFLGYTAGAGRGFLEGVDKVLKMTGAVDAPPDPAMTMDDIPGIRAFSARFPTANTRSIETFYEHYTQIKQEWESAKQIAGVRGTGIEVEMPAHLKTWEDTAKALSTLRKMARQVYNDMPPNQKTMSRKEIEEYREDKLTYLENIYWAMVNVARAQLGKAPLPTVGPTGKKQ